MNLCTEYLKVLNLGVSNAYMAKKVGCDPSTLHKWSSGTRNLSPQLEAAVESVILELKEQWMNIMNEENG